MTSVLITCASCAFSASSAETVVEVRARDLALVQAWGLANAVAAEVGETFRVSCACALIIIVSSGGAGDITA